MLNDTMAIYRKGVVILSKMAGVQIVKNFVKMYSCMLCTIDNFEIQKIIIERQLSFVLDHHNQLESKYKHVVFLPKWYVFLSTRVNLFVKDIKVSFVRTKKKLKRL